MLSVLWWAAGTGGLLRHRHRSGATWPAVPRARQIKWYMFDSCRTPVRTMAQIMEPPARMSMPRCKHLSPQQLYLALETSHT